MGIGKSSKVLGGVAAGAAPMILVDPTGTALLVTIGAGAGSVVSATVHAGKKAFKSLLRDREADTETRHYVRLITPSPNALQPSDAQMIRVEGAALIRKLAMSMEGLAVSGTLSIIVPAALVGTALNGALLAHEKHALKVLARKAGSKSQLIACIGIRELAKQVTIGLTIKTVTTVLFLGTELDTWWNGMNELTGVFDNVHHTPADRFVDAPFLKDTTGLVSAMPDYVQSHEGWGSNPLTWWQHPNPEVVMQVGAAGTLSETAASMAIEVPVSRVIDRQALKKN